MISLHKLTFRQINELLLFMVLPIALISALQLLICHLSGYCKAMRERGERSRNSVMLQDNKGVLNNKVAVEHKRATENKRFDLQLCSGNQMVPLTWFLHLSRCAHTMQTMEHVKNERRCTYMSEK